jgi:hypothetical protein
MIPSNLRTDISIDQKLKTGVIYPSQNGYLASFFGKFSLFFSFFVNFRFVFHCFVYITSINLSITLFLYQTSLRIHVFRQSPCCIYCTKKCIFFGIFTIDRTKIVCYNIFIV